MPAALLLAVILGPSASFQGQACASAQELREAPESSPGSVALVFEGFVHDADGAPAAGAVVVSSAGGKAVTDAGGAFSLEVAVPIEAQSVQVTARGSSDASLLASQDVALSPGSGSVWVGSLQLTPGGACTPSWVPTFGGIPVTDGPVLALTAFDDGSGNALYLGGSFSLAGGRLASRIARWDGSLWTPLGSGMNGAVQAFAAFDGGSGEALYAGGDFTTAGSVAANRIARWDGTSWTPLGSGLNGAVHVLTVFDDGNGAALYAGGEFTTAGGVTANRIARWDGASWTALGSGMNSRVRALAVFDDGGGTALFAGGEFLSAGGVSANRIAKWNGSAWTALGTGMSGSGEALHAGGSFPDGIATFDGTHWRRISTGRVPNNVFALTAFDDGGGEALYAGGQFNSAGDVFAPKIARWNGSTWAPLGWGLSDWPYCLAVFDDGSGEALFVGGQFSHAENSTGGFVFSHGIAKWDGSNWASLAGGVVGQVHSLTVFDDGSGHALYAGGTFTSSRSGIPASRIAKWDGSSWAALGSGLDGLVSALTVFDEGGGDALYAGGAFTTAGGAPASRIAKWDGSSWTLLGSGMNGPVNALAVFDDGSNGEALYAGGDFTIAGGVVANNIARWDGASWMPLGNGTNRLVNALAVFDDGSGEALCAGGGFTTAGGVAANSIARWDGSSWTALGSGTSLGLSSLAVFDDGSGEALYAGGSFTTAFDSGDSYLARWQGCRVACQTLDFETEDDGVTPLVNGEHIDTEFGELVTLSSSGPNAGLGIFDSSIGGPNDPSQDTDLLVDTGHILILQTENFPPDANDVFPRPNDDENGGTITFQFVRKVRALSVRLVDIDAGDGVSSLVLTDAEGLTRTYVVPGNWTGDRNAGGPGIGTLDLSTLAAQPGHGSTATAFEDAGFDGERLVQLDVHFDGSGGLDDLSVCWEPPFARAAVLPRNGSGVNTVTLSNAAMPVIGGTWAADLDCRTFGSGVAMLTISRQPDAGTIGLFGEQLIRGSLLHRTSRPFSGSVSRLTWNVPSDTALIGLHAYAQGQCKSTATPGGAAKNVSGVRGGLSNALDLVLGF